MARTLTEAAQAAKMIRKNLKAAFPHVKFTVRSSNYAGGDSVHIDWIDGPTSDEVDAVAGMHQQCTFDGMIDLKEYTNRRKDIPQVDWVQTQRGMSRTSINQIVEFLNRYWSHYGWNLQVVDAGHGAYKYENDKWSEATNGWMSHSVWPAFAKTSLICRECGEPAQFADAYCGACGAKQAKRETR